MTIAPSAPRAESVPSESAIETAITSRGPGAALLRTLTELTADLPDTDPGRVAAAALAVAAPPPTRPNCAGWPPRPPPV